ncbi:MAG: hypothetical protein SNH35_05580 [Rikenellaceae bacterium]
MRKFCYYIIALTFIVLMNGCSAAYWSGTSFSGDDMYDTHPTTSPRTVVASSPTPSYAAYQRPSSYYQYQYAPIEEQDSVVVVEAQYIPSTFDVWDEEQIATSNIYVSYSYDPWWGYRYDPFYYNYYGWGYPYYYHPHYPGWHRPRPIYTRYPPRRTNIVTRPSTSAPSRGTSSSSTSVRKPSSSSSSSSSSKSKSYRGQSVGTTTSGSYKRATTTFNSSSSSQSTSSSSSSSSSSSGKSSR